MKYSVEYKKTPHSPWLRVMTRPHDGSAISYALRKKADGAFCVRVVDSNGHTIFTS